MEDQTWLTIRISIRLRDWIRGRGKLEHRTMSGYVLAKLEREFERERAKAERKAQREGVAL